MTKKFIAGGCSFTFGHELSDDIKGKNPSQKAWGSLLHKLRKDNTTEYLCVASPGSGNCGIARRVFNAISTNNVDSVVVMWSYLSRYDWAMSRHISLEGT